MDDETLEMLREYHAMLTAMTKEHPITRTASQNMKQLLIACMEHGVILPEFVEEPSGCEMRAQWCGDFIVVVSVREDTIQLAICTDPDNIDIDHLILAYPPNASACFDLISALQPYIEEYDYGEYNDDSDMWEDEDD